MGGEDIPSLVSVFPSLYLQAFRVKILLLVSVPNKRTSNTVLLHV